MYNKKFHASLTPADLPGKKVGVRAYTQTTGAWVRNILMREHGLPLESVDWITTEGAHLAEYQQPAFARSAPKGSKLIDMLMNGEVDAAILGNDLPDDPLIAPVIPGAKEAGLPQPDDESPAPASAAVAKRLEATRLEAEQAQRQGLAAALADIARQAA